jgi:lipopolysaccharide export system protein LptA
VWTPKRVLLLILGLAVFTAAYGVYAYFLGRVDGLPPLPPEYEAKVTEGDVPKWDTQRPPVDLKLIKAFGQDCQEIRRTIKLEVQTRGVVLASDEFSIEPDGRVKLKPFSIAIFSKDKGDGRYPEINTIRSDIGYLTFDQPISNAQEMGTRKIVGGELVCQVVQDGTEPLRRGEGGVRIVNNRHTPERDDDLTLFTPGPVYFQDNLHQIWTREPVVITDEQTKPKPTTINAIGMDVYLTSDSDAPAKPEPAGRRRKGNDAVLVSRKKDNNAPSVTGVKAIVLRSDVEMHLWVDANSGFMGTDSSKKAKDGAAEAAKAPPAGKNPATAAPQAPPEKAQVVIKTQGPFLYDCLTDHARFDISQHPGPHPNNVEVHRQHGPNGAWDQLICDHLELQFSRKSAQPPPAPAKPTPAKAAPAKSEPAATSEVELQIETAHAWGTQVTITSDAEALTALGNDLVYNAVTKETTLCGTPEMIAMKDGNEIVAQKLVLKGSSEDKDSQQAEAKGPGRIKLLNRENGTRPHGARWKDMMYFTKDGGYDLLTLTGEAVFEDSEHGQFLQADRLKVWLESADPATGTEKPPTGASAAGAGDDAQRRRPHHMEALGHVIAKSAEMSVHDTDRLTVRFKDVATLPGQQLPNSAPAADNGAAKPAATPAASAAPAATSAPATGAKAGTQAANPPPKNPFDIQARSIDADILRSGTKNELEKLTCEGSVHVQQQPATPQDKGVDIIGDTLLLLHFAEGHVLTVTGDLAKVELEKLTIEGPEVNIDQKDNKAWVVGLGFMRMPSDANFQGEPIKDRPDNNKEPVYLTVHWNRDMFFDGKSAVFHGGIQAEQENSRLACQELQVFLDRFVSLKQTEKTDPPAKVKKLVCDRSVRVEERKFELPDNKRLIGYQWMAAPELVVDNEENTAHASGPGEVRIMQPGPKDEAQRGPGTPEPPRTPSSPPAPEEMKLTRINYWGSMFGNNNTRTAIFYNNVEVVYVPSDDPNLTVDVDKLPQGAMYLRCNQLKVYSRRRADGKASQEMEAHGKASVQAQDYWGRADIIKYDESKEVLVFEAGEGNLATLNRVVRRGEAPQELRGKKIFYWRQSGTYKIEGGVVGTGITGQEKR